MTQSRAGLSKMLGWLSGPPKPSEPEQRLRVVNLTRNTTVASSLEVAATGPKRNKGLLGRKGLEPGTGLWIVPCESVHTFWMQFPIDLVYLDRSYRIRKVRSNVGPWRMSACLSAHSVIELPSGAIRETETQPGDQLEFSPAELSESSNSAGANRETVQKEV
jgi:uncharacterized protein